MCLAHLGGSRYIYIYTHTLEMSIFPHSHNTLYTYMHSYIPIYIYIHPFPSHPIHTLPYTILHTPCQVLYQKDNPKYSMCCKQKPTFYHRNWPNLGKYTTIERYIWHSPHILVYIDPFLNYMLASVPIYVDLRVPFIRPTLQYVTNLDFPEIRRFPL